MIIRQENPTDYAMITAVETAAFGQSDEANMVNKARSLDDIVVSLVAVKDNLIIGHALYTKVKLISDECAITAVSLGPIAVHPDFQKQGIGSKLIAEGNRLCQAKGYDFIFVLGHATYYPRFGFRTTKQFGIRCEYDVSEEVFMVLELTPNSLQTASGTVFYGAAFK